MADDQPRLVSEPYSLTLSLAVHRRASPAARAPWAALPAACSPWTAAWSRLPGERPRSCMPCRQEPALRLSLNNTPTRLPATWPRLMRPCSGGSGRLCVTADTGMQLYAPPPHAGGLAWALQHHERTGAQAHLLVQTGVWAAGAGGAADGGCSCLLRRPGQRSRVPQGKPAPHVACQPACCVTCRSGSSCKRSSRGQGRPVGGLRFSPAHACSRL